MSVRQAVQERQTGGTRAPALGSQQFTVGRRELLEWIGKLRDLPQGVHQIMVLR
jgi:hypothetical protein